MQKNMQSYMIRCLFAKTKLLFLLFTFYSIVLACKKVDSEVIGKDILPNGDDIVLIETDTFQLVTYTQKDDSVRTDERPVSPLGRMNDPVFGTTATSIFAQFRLPENNLDFSAVTIDSVVLSLKFQGKTAYYGNLNSPQTFKVFELSQNLRTDSQYYSTSWANYDPQELGSWSGQMNLTDSVMVFQGSVAKKLPPQVRIHITSASFINKLKNAGINFATTEAFLQYLKGVVVVPVSPPPAPGEGAIVNVDFLNGYSGLTIYYSDSLSKFFPINENSARFNNITHDYTGTVLAGQLNLKQNRDTCYAQSMAGLKTLIKFPTIFDLVKNNNNKVVSVLSAELILPTYTINSPTDYPFPLQTMFIESDSMGKNKQTSGVVPFGTYNTDKSQVKTSLTYSLLPKNYLQTILDTYRKTGVAADNGIFFVTSYNYAGMERIILNTSKTGVVRPKLKLIYTVVP